MFKGFLIYAATFGLLVYTMLTVLHWPTVDVAVVSILLHLLYLDFVRTARAGLCYLQERGQEPVEHK